MKMKIIAVAGLVSALLGGCVVGPPVYREPVIYEPPPPRVESPGYPPMVGYLWIGGYWTWSGHRYDWVPGRWEAPRPGYRWMAPRWEREGQYWRQQEGRWERDNAPRVVPVPVPAPRYERHDERRPDSAPGYREPPRPTVEPPRRDFERRDGDRPNFERRDGERRDMMERREAPRAVPTIPTVPLAPQADSRPMGRGDVGGQVGQPREAGRPQRGDDDRRGRRGPDDERR